MNKIYLVKNLEGENVIVSICSNVEVANRMANFIRNNYAKDCEPAMDFIVVEEVTLRDDVDLMWDIYPEDRTPGFTYAE